ncbi:hypothetical protein [Streptomyces chartreusis]|uniref:hypothetical protein n=1 Tax=Streptomyces chartreusis TaxID=1969 RepID=UPI0034029350
MLSTRRYQHAATAGAALLAAACVGSFAHRSYVPAILFGLGVLVLTEAALREHRRLRRRRLEDDWARRRALGESPPPLTPCCLLARSSGKDIHDQNCTSDHTLSRFLDRIEQQHREET